MISTIVFIRRSNASGVKTYIYKKNIMKSIEENIDTKYKLYFNPWHDDKIVACQYLLKTNWWDNKVYFSYLTMQYIRKCDKMNCCLFKIYFLNVVLRKTSYLGKNVYNGKYSTRNMIYMKFSRKTRHFYARVWVINAR